MGKYVRAVERDVARATAGTAAGIPAIINVRTPAANIIVGKQVGQRHGALTGDEQAVVLILVEGPVTANRETG